MIAGHLIRKYAARLESDPHNVLVYTALKRTHLALSGRMPEMASFKLERGSASQGESSLATSASDHSDVALAGQPSKTVAEFYQD